MQGANRFDWVGSPTWPQVCRLYSMARLIADIVWEYFPPAADGTPAAEDLRWSVVDPYMRRTKNGLALEFEGGVPTYLWTPLGRWRFIAAAPVVGGVDRSAMVLTQLVTSEWRFSREPTPDEELVFRIRRFRGATLPIPMLAGMSNPRPARAAWIRLTDEWRRRHGIAPPTTRE